MQNKWFGDRTFYRQIFRLMLPIMLQNGITSFVNMLDNLMVGRVGTAEMAGVAIANQLFMVFNLCIFGAMSGAGIFGAQFFGKKDFDGLRYTFRFKLLVCFGLSALGIAVFTLAGEPLIGLYLKGESGALDPAATLYAARSYMLVMLVGLLPSAVVQCYASTLRETGQTVLPMVSSTIAVFTNLVFNYILIFGKFGAPELGVLGAAVATVIARFVELSLMLAVTAKNRAQTPYLVGALRSLHVPRALVRQIALKGMPLLINEALWSSAIATQSQCYSMRGLDVVAANNIASTFSQLFSVAFLAVGAAIGIVLVQLLGAGKVEEAKLSCWRLIVFSALTSVVMGGLFALCTGFIPRFYNTSDEVRALATNLMRLTTIAMPLDAIANACYFSLRSGGKTFITFLFDSGFAWAVQVPVALVLAYLTDLPILPMYLVCHLLSIIKATVGLLFIRQGGWAKNIVGTTSDAESVVQA